MSFVRVNLYFYDLSPRIFRTDLVSPVGARRKSPRWISRHGFALTRNGASSFLTPQHNILSAFDVLISYQSVVKMKKTSMGSNLRTNGDRIILKFYKTRPNEKGARNEPVANEKGNMLKKTFRIFLNHICSVNDFVGVNNNTRYVIGEILAVWRISWSRSNFRTPNKTEVGKINFEALLIM